MSKKRDRVTKAAKACDSLVRKVAKRLANHAGEPALVQEISESARVLLAAFASLQKANHAVAAYEAWTNRKLKFHLERVNKSLATIQQLAAKEARNDFEAIVKRSGRQLAEFDAGLHRIAAERLLEHSSTIRQLMSIVASLLQGSLSRRSANTCRRDAVDIAKTGVGFIPVVGNIVSAIDGLWTIVTRPDKDLGSAKAFYQRERVFRHAVQESGTALEWLRGFTATLRGVHRTRRRAPTLTWDAARKLFEKRKAMV